MNLNLKKRKGALTIEATIATPFFIMVILSIAFLTKVLFIQEQIQYSLNQTAQDFAEYSYIYYLTSAKEIDQKFIDKYSNKDTSIDIKSIIETATNTNKDSSKTKDLIKTISDYFISKSFDNARTKVGTEITKTLFTQYLNKALFQKRYVGAYIISNTSPALDSIDFSSSSYLNDGSTIDLVAKYTIKVKLPINIVPDIKIQQRATVKAWTNGDGTYDKFTASLEDKTIWDKSPFQRGREITKNEQGNLDNTTITEVRSVDTTRKTYNDTKNIYYTIKNSIDNFNENSSKSNFTTRKLIIIYPEGSLSIDSIVQENKKISQYAATKGIFIEFKEGYGKPSD